MNPFAKIVPALLLANTILCAADLHPNGDVFTGGSAPVSPIANQVQIGAGQIAVGNLLAIGQVTPIRPLHIGNPSGGEMILEPQKRTSPLVERIRPITPPCHLTISR